LTGEILFDAKNEAIPPDFILEEGDEFFINYASLKVREVQKHSAF